LVSFRAALLFASLLLDTSLVALLLAFLNPLPFSFGFGLLIALPVPLLIVLPVNLVLVSSAVALLVNVVAALFAVLLLILPAVLPCAARFFIKSRS
jgi:hypothetical protein